MSKNKSKGLKIVVNSTIKERLALNYLNPLQGNLKELPESSFNKLKNSILKKGFLYPFFVWENKEDGQIYIIDGHQRHKVLTALRNDGYDVPQLPVIFIPAESIKEAKENLAVAASQFGKFTEQGVIEFFGDLEMPEIEMFEIPFLDFSNVLEPDSGKTVEVAAHEREIKNTSKEIDLGDFEHFDHQCPKCGFEYNK